MMSRKDASSSCICIKYSYTINWASGKAADYEWKMYVLVFRSNQNIYDALLSSRSFIDRSKTVRQESTLG